MSPTKTKTKPRAKASVKKKTSATAIPKKRKAVRKKTKTIAAGRKSLAAVLHFSESGREAWSLKRATYMLCAVVLGLLIALIMQSFMELVFLKNYLASGTVPESSRFLGAVTFLPPSAIVLFMLSGICFGFSVGSWGWNAVYVQGRHRMFKK